MDDDFYYSFISIMTLMVGIVWIHMQYWCYITLLWLSFVVVNPFIISGHSLAASLVLPLLAPQKKKKNWFASWLAPALTKTGPD